MTTASADPAIPGADNLFQPVQDVYGPRLALVFGNEAPGGLCPFYARQCYHCDIGAGEGLAFTPDLNAARLDFFRQHYRDLWPDLAHLVLYNSGSTLNLRELSRATLTHLLRFAADLPGCRVVSLDSREMYVTPDALDLIVATLRHDQTPRIVLGLESQDDAVRIGTLNKKMTRPAIQSAFRHIAAHGGRIGVDLNVVFQPPPLTGQAAVDEAIATAAYGLELSRHHGVPVDFNFHPYYPSRIGLEKFPDHPRAEIAAGFQALQGIQTLLDPKKREAPKTARSAQEPQREAPKIGGPGDAAPGGVWGGAPGKLAHPGQSPKELDASGAKPQQSHEVVENQGPGAISPSMLFIGWQDESHDQQQSQRQDELDRCQQLFHQFNITQDPRWLAQGLTP